MLLPLRNELRLRIGPLNSGAEVWSGGLFPRLAGEASFADRNAEPIGALLDALDRGELSMPRHASICAEDEYVYYATLPGLGSWKEAHAAACDYFADMLGEDDMLVDTTLAPCGTRWIAAAVDAAQVDGWRDTLERHDIELRSVRPALLEDLWALRPRVELVDGLLVLLRSEGASMISLRANAVCDIVWERFDVADSTTLTERIHSAARDLGFDGGTASPAPVCLVPQNADGVQSLLELAQRRGWQFSDALLRQSA